MNSLIKFLLGFAAMGQMQCCRDIGLEHAAVKHCNMEITRVAKKLRARTGRCWKRDISEVAGTQCLDKVWGNLKSNVCGRSSAKWHKTQDHANTLKDVKRRDATVAAAGLL